METRRYGVTVSFAGEDRAVVGLFVKLVAEAGYRVFYDACNRTFGGMTCISTSISTLTAFTGRLLPIACCSYPRTMLAKCGPRTSYVALRPGP
jgi:hypothetical protein